MEENEEKQKEENEAHLRSMSRRVSLSIWRIRKHIMSRRNWRSKKFQMPSAMVMGSKTMGSSLDISMRSHQV